MISVLILTRNEERDLPRCLQSVSWSDDVHVFDSFSTDRTCAIAKEHGAKVTQRAFDTYAAQRNAALHGLPFRHPWVLVLDADERVPAALRDELARFVPAAGPGVHAARLRRRDHLYGTWLKHAQASPFYIRLVHPQYVHYERAVNEVLKVNGAIADLAQPFDHYPFSKGMRHWVRRHNAYSSLEAELSLKSRRGETPFSLRHAFFSRDFNERRYHQKELFYRLPGRPLLRFLYLYVLKGGFLDGRAGLTYAALQGWYEYMIVLKMRELMASNDSPHAGRSAEPSVAASIQRTPPNSTSAKWVMTHFRHKSPFSRREKGRG